MKNEKIAEKMLMCLEKSKYGKFDRLFLKNRNNEELWDILLQNPIITEDYLHWQPDEYQTSVYQYLGSKLSQDKEFLLSLRKKDPLAFLESMKKVQYDDETIKSFFDEHPAYVRDLPDNLKYDYDYAASLILRLQSENITLYCGDMRYDYLQNPKIKEALIKVAGEAIYKKTLLCSLAEYPEQLKNISPEEF